MRNAIFLMMLWMLTSCQNMNEQSKIEQTCKFTSAICQENYDTLSNGINKFKAMGGLFVVMDVKTSEIVDEISINMENLNYHPDNIVKLLGFQNKNTPQQILAAYSLLVNNKEKLANLRKTLRNNIIKGSGKNADVQEANVHGITSTDFISKDSKEVYATFLGDFTSGEQQYALILVLDTPQGIKSTYGLNSAGWNAVKVAREVIQNIME